MYQMLSIARTNLFILMSVAAMALASTQTTANEYQVGEEEFRISCVSCHGLDGKGHGPMTEFLKLQPSNLTLLAKNNGGQYPALKPGQFPFYQVFQMIDGRTLVSGHGDRDMPIWGNRYLIQEGEKYGPMGAEKVIRERILELVRYVQSLQE